MFKCKYSDEICFLNCSKDCPYDDNPYKYPCDVCVADSYENCIGCIFNPNEQIEKEFLCSLE